MASRPVTVCLIDDDEVDHRMYKRTISRSGVDWDVTMFTFADEALARLKATPELKVDLIYLDINMPRMNGFEFLEAALAEFGSGFASVVVAMLTTSLNPADRERAKGFEVVREFIHKPLTTEHVLEADRLIRSHK